ncbi:hemolysin family protein [Novosphingobium sp.]|uniref:hemolysin family protein n=1 Tax=Novosphingobium sp. TaxID=1874826 RepID=UPI0031E0C9AE
MGADLGRAGDGGNGDADSKSSLWRAVKRFFDSGEVDQSLRAHLEEVIDEHEDADTAQGTAQGDLQQSEREMLRNLLHFSEMDAADICIPRGEIIAVPNTASWDEVVAAFATHGHSRMPVYRETLDEVIGMVLIKDVFPFLASGNTPTDWLTLLRQPLFVPCPRPALDVLADMRRGRVHLAVVLDEYSGTEGIVTFEDLVEEIVGDVEDEHDDAPVALLVPLEGGLWDADARALLEDVGEEIDPRLAEVEEDIDTLGGLAFLLAEQVPAVGTILPHDSGWRIEVTAGDERHVTRLRLHPPHHSRRTDGRGLRHAGFTPPPPPARSGSLCTDCSARLGQGCGQ